MPVYVYSCRACGYEFEQRQSFSDASLTDCPECAGQLRKLFNSVGVVFKGSGFYRTDSRRPDNKTEMAASGQPKSTGPAKVESGTTSASTPSPAKDTSTKAPAATAA